MSDWVTKSAIEQLAALKNRTVSSLELLELTITRSKLVENRLNPFALGLHDRARAAAEKADKQLKKKKVGALCGLPVTVKDSQWLAGVRCANGSPTLAGFVPDKTCTAIQKMEDAGAVIFAKTTCPEFSLSGTANSPLYGSTFNPWDVTRTPGGSSGGAAAAIASGAGSLSLGGDGGGSIRIPAAFCGIVGFKPTHGTVTRSPGFATWDSLVSYGPMCRTVADARLMYSVIANSNVKRPRKNARRAELQKVIASVDLGFAPVNADIRELFHQLTQTMANAGVSIATDTPGLPSSVVTWATIATHDMWEHKGNKQSSHYKDPGDIGGYAEGFIQFGSQFSELELADAQAYRNTIHQSYMDLFKRQGSNILITPTLGCEAFHHTQVFPEKIENTEISYPWLDWAGMLYDPNLTGMPACSIPMGLGNNGLPVSLQIIGAPGCDWQVLDAAEKIEKLIDWQYPVAPEFASNPIIHQNAINGSVEQAAAFSMQ